MTTSAEKELKPVTVEKPIPVAYDLGNMAVFDPNPLEHTKLTDSSEVNTYLKDVTRDNVQLLLNQILSLPLKTTTDSSSGQNATMTLINLPNPSTPLPREKAIPKAKEPTRWELFAAKKGIKAKGKDGKMVYDEDAGEWAPKWGYGGKNKKVDDQWLVEVEDEVKDTSKELIDPRSLRRDERKKLIKKNELQHKRNLQGRK
ncbi:unnamed protein product [Kuraishia capsulata CBS 1993]|uniref:Ribosome biogenesis regulatory protein n=1 Tax=Kuraishia capsulata CBS 1993 TaxID=1382522 RepID=W6MUI7_9ASCO|nr:uncharacterized protein KUCA_T00001630001 [Kuraishia capsulata CBS 1993]CDK25660.1 unnamed protein product [Kuraishia capsulata CBS 1993]